jgi:hypothetical protein
VLKMEVVGRAILSAAAFRAAPWSAERRNS